MNADERGLSTSKRLGIGLVAVLVIAAGGAVLASAAGDTAVSLSPSERTVTPGTTTTYDVVVESADGGVGAFSATVGLAEPDAVGASITDVSVAGDAGLVNTSYGEDNASVTIDAALMDTADTGSVAIATVTVEGEGPAGATDVTLDVETVGDEDGNSYEVTGTSGASLTVSGGGDGGATTTAATDTETTTVETTTGTTTAADGGDATTTATGGPDVTTEPGTPATDDAEAGTTEAATDGGTPADTGTTDAEAEPTTGGGDGAGDATTAETTTSDGAVGGNGKAKVGDGTADDGTADDGGDTADGGTSTDGGSERTAQPDGGADDTTPVPEAGSAAVGLEPADATVASGESATYEIGVESAGGGVGALEATVALDDPSVASIGEVELAGNPPLNQTNVTDDGSAATIDVAYLGNALADDPDGVTVATVTVAGEQAGTSPVALSVSALGDAQGEIYGVNETTDASVTVEG
ncbi:hypothetical protein BRC90_06075 [Halobacteriales archaeon QS_4_69_34]|nr:MAG: hypothetical protein BRC90_06075 [Halobacteriales archaeon QS_4_69_34]